MQKRNGRILKIKKSTLIRLIALAACAVLAITAVLVLTKETREKQRGGSVYDSMNNKYTTKGDTAKDDDSDGGKGEETPTEEENGSGAVSEEVPFQVDYDSLKAVNDDYVGWLYMEGSGISYPVVRGTDNTKYLSVLITGEANSNGTLFVDAINKGDFSDPNTIIYGHNMDSTGEMFGTLKSYREGSSYSASPYFYIITKNKTYRYSIVSVATVPSTDKVYDVFSEKGDTFREWIDYILSISAIETDTSMVTEDSDFVTLSTCYMHGNDYRDVVIGCLDGSYFN